MIPSGTIHKSFSISIFAVSDQSSGMIERFATVQIARDKFAAINRMSFTISDIFFFDLLCSEIWFCTYSYILLDS